MIPSQNQPHETSLIVVGPDKWRAQIASAAEPLNGSLRLEAAESLLDALLLAESRKTDGVLIDPTEHTPVTSDDLDALGELTHKPRLILSHEARESFHNDTRVDAWLNPEDGTEALTHAINLQTNTPTTPDTPPPPTTETPAPTDELAPQPQPQPDTPDIPGDVDLIDALLEGEKALRSMLLRILEMQTSATDAQLLPIDAEVDPEHTALEVAHEGHLYAQLVLPHDVDITDMRRWSAWMARWLMLSERQQQMQELAFRDPLTGVRNRRYFDRFLTKALDRAHAERSQVTLLIFDIDDFKAYNDRYGHAAGDTILREAARLMQSMVREHDVVARIGGDEFAVIFWDATDPREPNSRHPNDIVMVARRFQKALSSHHFPELLDEALSTLTISGGLATYPWDGRDAAELMEYADQKALLAKRQGKNAITFGPGAADNTP